MHCLAHLIGENFVVKLKNSMKRDILTLPDGIAFFLPDSWRIVIYSHYSLSVWGLPHHAGGDYLLLLHWADPEVKDEDDLKFKLPEDDEDQLLTACYHENKFTSDFCEVLVDVSDLYSMNRLNFFLDGIENLLLVLINEGNKCSYSKDEVYWSLATTYLGAHVNSSFGAESKSVMSILCSLICKSVNSANISEYRVFMTLFLSSPNVSWIPQSNYAPGANPLGILLEGARTKPSVMDFAKDMITWCTGLATKYGRQEYLYLVLPCMPELIYAHTDLALEVTQSFAHVQLVDVEKEEKYDRKFIIDNHAIVNLLSINRVFSYMVYHIITASNKYLPYRWIFDNKEPAIYNCNNPILQFRHNPNRPAPQNDYFTESIFCPVQSSLVYRNASGG